MHIPTHTLTHVHTHPLTYMYTCSSIHIRSHIHHTHHTYPRHTYLHINHVTHTHTHAYTMSHTHIPTHTPHHTHTNISTCARLPCDTLLMHTFTTPTNIIHTSHTHTHHTSPHTHYTHTTHTTHTRTHMQVELIRRDYVANGGWETFLSYEDPKQGINSACPRLLVSAILFQDSACLCNKTREKYTMYQHQ